MAQGCGEGTRINGPRFYICYYCLRPDTIAINPQLPCEGVENFRPIRGDLPKPMSAFMQITSQDPRTRSAKKGWFISAGHGQRSQWAEGAMSNVEKQWQYKGAARIHSAVTNGPKVKEKGKESRWTYVHVNPERILFQCLLAESIMQISSFVSPSGELWSLPPRPLSSSDGVRAICVVFSPSLS